MFGPRSATLTLYGDYVRHKGGEIGIGSLITLLENFDLTEQSIRSAVSRMCRMGLLKARRDGPKSYYSLTEEGADIVDKGAQRIFSRTGKEWDGLWSTVVYFIPEDRRQARDTLRQELTWMGYGPLSTATWISPRDLTGETTGLVKKMKIKEYVQIFRSKHYGCSDGSELISRAWDLERIHRRYAGFIGEFSSLLEKHRRKLAAGETVEPSQCFVERFKLIDAYRRLPFFDPDLPLELLPGNWLRPEATALFDEYHDSLTEKATEYFDSVYNAY